MNERNHDRIRSAKQSLLATKAGYEHARNPQTRTDPRKPLVYVAGPYTHPDPVLNVRNACLAADEIVALGAAVVVPHLSMLWHTVSPKPLDAWYNIDLDVLDHCHAVALLPGESTGAQAEVTHARSRGIPVYSTDQPVAMRMLARFIGEWCP